VKFIASGTKYEFDDAKITFAEARQVEKVTGKTMAEIGRAGGGEDVTTLQAMIWVAMKRVDPTLKFVDLDDMPMGDLEMLTDDEAAEGPLDPTAEAAGDPEGASTLTG
jgi:hypothetical protein